MSLYYIGNSCANLFNNFVTPVALDAIHWKYYLVFIVMIAQFVVVVYFFFPETRGYGLEQISGLFEGDSLFIGKTVVQHSDDSIETLEKAQAELKDDRVEQIESVVAMNKIG